MNATKQSTCRVSGSLPATSCIKTRSDQPTVEISCGILPHIEYAVQFWSPHKRQDIDKIKKMQRRATNVIPEIRSYIYTYIYMQRPAKQRRITFAYQSTLQIVMYVLKANVADMKPTVTSESKQSQISNLKDSRT